MVYAIYLTVLEFDVMELILTKLAGSPVGTRIQNAHVDKERTSQYNYYKRTTRRVKPEKGQQCNGRQMGQKM